MLLPAACALILVLLAMPLRAWALWTQNGIPLTPSPSSIAAAPDLAQGPSGNFYLAWYDGSALRVLRIQADGAVTPG